MDVPLIWLGGKYYMTSKILPLIPDHDVYCEVFGGAAQMLFAKPHSWSNLEVYNDINSDLVNFFRILQDDEKFEQFHRLATLSLHSRELFIEYRETWKQQTDIVKRVHQWYVVLRQSYSAIIGGRTPAWGYTKGSKSPAKLFKKKTDGLIEIVDRWRDVQVEKLDWREAIQKYDGKNTFFYLDPPYVTEARIDCKYDHEMNDKDHEELVDMLLNVKAKVILSGYDNQIYNRLGWDKQSFDSYCHAAGNHYDKKEVRNECVWLNFQNQLTLFD